MPVTYNIVRQQYFKKKGKKKRKYCDLIDREFKTAVMKKLNELQENSEKEEKMAEE